MWREKILYKPRRRGGVWYAEREEKREQDIGLWQEEREEKKKIIDTNLREPCILCISFCIFAQL